MDGMDQMEQYQTLLPLLMGQSQGDPLSSLQGVMALRNGAMLPAMNKNLNGLISAFNQAVSGGGGGGGGIGDIIGGIAGIAGAFFGL